MGENEIERRCFAAQVRAQQAGNDDQPVIDGYAAVFNELSDDLGGFYERIERGAFARTIESDDIRGLWNHNPDYPLGRTRSGTLRLQEDETGLQFVIQPPETSYARDLLVSMGRGDVDQMSFGFWVVRDRWEQTGGQVVRNLLEVKLFDVSPVTYPAYPQTSAQVRARLESFHSERQAAEEQTDGEAAAQARHANRKRKLELLKLKV